MKITIVTDKDEVIDEITPDEYFEFDGEKLGTDLSDEEWAKEFVEGMKEDLTRSIMITRIAEKQGR